MTWRDIDNSDLAQALVDALGERPYLTTAELCKRLVVRGFAIQEPELEIILSYSDSPFYVEPQRWYLDPAIVIEDAEQVDDVEDFESEDEAEVQPEENSDLDESWAGPSRWIGPELRAWQHEAFMAWALAQERGIVEAITGTGKTVVGAYAAAYVLDYGHKVVITVPTLDLMDQWISQIQSCIDDVVIGRLGDGHHDSIEDVEVLVSTINSGSRHYMHSTQGETLLIADEVHRMGSASFAFALEEEITSRLGLTATLERNNDTGVEDLLLPYFGDVIYSYGYQNALADEVLAPFRLAFVGCKFTPEEQEEYTALGSDMSRLARQLREAGLVKTDGPEIFGVIGGLSRQESLDFRQRRWAQKFMANLSRRRKLQASASSKIQAINALSDSIALSRRALVFTETKDASAAIAQSLRDDDISAWAFDSSLDREERATLLGLFKNGDVHVLCAPRVLDEGIDVPQADLGVIVSASQSRRQMIQRLGRIVRPNPDGKPSTLFLLYLEGTREDPQQGGHEGFLEEVLPYAAETVWFTADTHANVIASWISQ